MIQNEVFLEPISHTYKGVSDGRVYESVSRVLKKYEGGPDYDVIAGNVAGKGKFASYKTKDAVLALWKENANRAMSYGTGWHNAIERYQKEFIILPEDKDKEATIKEICLGYKDYYRIESEATLYHPSYGVAGTSDKILFPKKNGKVFCIADYKTALSAGGVDFFNKNDEYMLYPVDHLQASKYSKYNLQLSIYALMTEYLTGMKCRNMWVTFIKEGDPVKYIPMPYLRNEAKEVLVHFNKRDDFQEDVVVNESIELPNVPDFI